MFEVFGKNLNYAELLRRVGDTGQVAGIREYTYSGGRADGVKAVEVNNGALRFEMLPSRCLDIASASWKGMPFGYRSKSGIRHPAYFAKNDPTGSQDNFLGGVMTTCGLHNIGPASDCAGRRHELHGELANVPAERVAIREQWDDGGCLFEVEGEVRHSAFYHADLVLRRRVSTRLGENRLTVEDEVENRDFAPTPCLALYHVQFGFPFLGPESVLITSPGDEVRSRSGSPEDRAEAYARFGNPEDGAEEACFYHRLEANAAGMATACLFNPELGDKGMGAYVRYRVDTLPLLVQWRMPRSREYVCGLEPATARLENRTAEDLADCTLAPLEKRRFQVEIGVIEGEEACRRFAAS